MTDDKPTGAGAGALCTPFHCWSLKHHSMDCPARQPAAVGLPEMEADAADLDDAARELRGPHYRLALLVDDLREQVRDRQALLESAEAKLAEAEKSNAAHKVWHAAACESLKQAEARAERAELKRVEAEHGEALALNEYLNEASKIPEGLYQEAVTYGIDQCNRADAAEDRASRAEQERDTLKAENAELKAKFKCDCGGDISYPRECNVCGNDE